MQEKVSIKYDITDSNVANIIKKLATSVDRASKATPQGLTALKLVLQNIQAKTVNVDPMDYLEYVNTLAELGTAIQQREISLSDPTPEVSTPTTLTKPQGLDSA